MKQLIEKLEKDRQLSKEEYIELLQGLNEEIVKTLNERARAIAQSYYGNKVFIRGLIEYTNVCKQNCHYCGIRRDNKQVHRYRLMEEEILSCCHLGYALGFRTFVLQGGEDPFFTDDRLVTLIKKIKRFYPDCAITLSLGVRSEDSYGKLKEAGANRYLLRHETAVIEHFNQLHPKAEQSLQERKKALWTLKSLGYTVGSGIMIGSPGQKLEYIAEDLLFLRQLNPEMIGIGPFLPHKDTAYRQEKKGDLLLTLGVLSILRLMFPNVLLPSTTALASLEPRGRERGILAGANVIMPNLSPENVRKDYSLYDNKLSTGSEAAESLHLLKADLEKIGYEIDMGRGDPMPLRKDERVDKI